MRNRETGSALLMVVVVTLMIAGISAAFFSISLIEARATTNTMFGVQSLYIAESAIAINIDELNKGNAGFSSGDLSQGAFEVIIEDWAADGEDNDNDGQIDNGNEAAFTRLIATGIFQGQERTIEVILNRNPGGPFWNAVYAGNNSDDPNYTMPFGGKGGQADQIIGDVYSGGDIEVSDDAQFVSEQVMAKGNVTGYPGWEQGVQSNPDLQAMEYESNSDHYVADAFNSPAAYEAFDNAGGTAWQMPQSDPNHIFRKNPDDRTDETSGTVKDDFFLEDPYAPFRVDPNQNGSDAYQLQLTNTNGNHVTYYIDGNLWLHNKHSYSFKFMHPEINGVQVTFVVKGNIYFSDNLFYNNKNKDAVVFIAMKDPSVNDSGNVYFGDPRFGTLNEMNSFMYAENNFYDNNLSATGSSKVKLFGNMTAGNHVAINRDFGNRHTKLTVEFDDRIRTGEVNPPGIPPQPASEDTDWFIASWRQLPSKP